MFTSGQEPIPLKSIVYHIDYPNLLPAADLHDDEWEELKNSRLGVFIKLVHLMIYFQLDIKKKYELWSFVGPEPVRFSLIEFEHFTGLNCKYIDNLDNPAIKVDELSEQTIAACKRCGEWYRNDRMWQGYLAIYTGYIEGKKYSSTTRASPARLFMMYFVKGKDSTRSYTINWFIQVLELLIYFSFPEFVVSFGNLIRNKPSHPLVEYREIKDKICQRGYQRTRNITAKVVIPNKKVCDGYYPIAPVDKNKTKLLAGLNGLGRRLRAGSWDLYACLVPKYSQTKNIWRSKVDDIYAPVNYKIDHWIAIWISIPNKHIIIWDSILSHIRTSELQIN
ncbi:hypothetical protein N665_0158s0038 [Sinapis alba]|nr:hypothetical protein N665_0158s0038 [Sinapis alba]